jgi:FKBP-type peptidyl-prolyl cis-trans isomerase FklB
MDKLSYSFGILIGQNLREQGLTDLDANDFSQGVADYLAGREPKIDIKEVNAIIQGFMEEQQVDTAQHNLVAGAAFLQENAQREGVVALPSGLQYEIIRHGNGRRPKPSDRVTTHYHGTLIDGTVFDSSVERGQPATFPVNGVIQGWVEALQLMQEGAKWRLFVPSDLAYGERGAGGLIGPFATLVFDVELLKVL